MRRNVGILTFHCATNYGGVLQAYSLSKLIKRKGYNVEFINLRPNNISNDKPKRPTDFLFRLVFNRFEKNYYPKYTHLIKNESDLVFLNNKFDFFIVGSDQVWNKEITKDIFKSYFFDFVNKGKPKIAYAASFGSAEPVFNNQEKEEIITLLKEFTVITLREDSGKKYCENILGISAKVVLDPTLLLNDFSEIIKCNVPKNSDIICLKFIKSKEFIEIANYLATELDCSVKLVNSPQKYPGIKNIYFPSVDKWLSLIFNAKFVITDSFHALCFCIMFKKDFIVVPGKIERFTRLQNLLVLLEIENRVFQSIEEFKNSNIWNCRIDFEKVHNRLNQERECSMFVLEEALKMAEKYSN
ncbi:MAG: polysaccharide pyruvyl transferase family protein [Bacteroidales bacterium]|nr:polysaccharide pyruvyl transferase family protein [Bacteroidales bacterium]